MKIRTFNLSLPIELVEKIDARARQEYVTRSAYIKHAVVAQLRADGAFRDGEPAPSQTPEDAKRARLKEYLGKQSKEGYTEDVY